MDDGTYVPCDVYADHRGRFKGTHLVLEQRGSSAEPAEWHLNQDLAITLGLKREGDIWVSLAEGYIEVARFRRHADRSPRRFEIRASHLKDYLCARQMALYVTSYRSRVGVVEDASTIEWSTAGRKQTAGADRWEGRVSAIHEGGMPYRPTTVFHLSRADVDKDEDVPTLGLPTGDNVKSSSWTTEPAGRQLYRVEGELGRCEWVEPGSQSPIVRGDRLPPTVFFITDAEGKQESKDTLVEGGRWLWFRPDVMPALVHRCGGSLEWYTRETGRVRCSPVSGVHFGVNAIGLVNVYAKDIALLPEWQQRIWSGHNVPPEGKVSEELLASQVEADPRNTQAPESWLATALETLDRLFVQKFGGRLVRHHGDVAALILRAHRFRATDRAALLSLAKDLARLTADSFDTTEIQKHVRPPENEKWRSLKSLEELLATRVGREQARQLLGPLVGIWNLRLADAHLPRGDVAEAFTLAGVDPTAPLVVQGHQLLASCVDSLYAIGHVIESWDDVLGNQNRST